MDDVVDGVQPAAGYFRSEVKRGPSAVTRPESADWKAGGSQGSGSSSG
jgi:hypothetical protein